MSIEIDARNLAKWLNEEQLAPIDKQALARVLAHIQMAEQQEPVAWLWELTGEVTTDPDRADGIWLPLYTSTPPSKPWVGLTDDDVKAVFDSVPTAECQSYEHWRSLVAIAIEAKLKENNE